MGMRWRIGDGKSIDIYKDNWLPGKGFAKVVSPHAPRLEGAQVVALINPNTRTWNINLLHQHFLSFESNRIKAIPLCWTDQRDRFIWLDSHNGEYTVRAGYQMLCQEANFSAASSSDSSHQSAFWKSIWKLHVPNKIKCFLWKICSNALPTKVNLKKRKVLEEAKFSTCLLDKETTLHVIWSCKKLTNIWAPCFSWVRTEYPYLQDMQELIYVVGQRENSLELFGVVAWFIWNQRNKLRLNERGLPTEKIFEAARGYLSDFQSKLQITKVQQPKGSIKW